MKSLINFTPILVFIILASCSDEEKLYPVCPASGQQLSCIVDNNGDIITQGAGQSIPEEYTEQGECRFGITSCTEIFSDTGALTEYMVVCNGYTAPSVEVCDSHDNDCDGLIDEDFDQDGDGYTQCDSRGADCWDNPNTPPPGMEGLDPWQAAEFNPAAAEVCDGFDNDCSCWNRIDGHDSNQDGLACSCSTDPDCFGADCCDEGIDEDLHPIPCFDGDPAALDKEHCRPGKKLCSNGSRTECIGQTLPQPEICNGIDDDCDGQIDNNIEAGICGHNEVGICGYGQDICVPGSSELICVGASYPQNEACNNLDDDCDGAVDEDLWDLCESACGSGVAMCSEGNWINCSAPQPDAEVCDGIDNDCDGLVDDNDPDVESCECQENDTQFCTSPLPMLDSLTGLPADPPYDSCGVGIQYCSEEGEWGPCFFFSPVEPELCNNWDDDCDGVIDGMTNACWTHPDPNVAPTDEGECSTGLSTCVAGEWGGYDDQNNFIVGVCEGETWPQDEVCNELDDDCDGLTDEDLNPHEKVDMVFLIDGSGSMNQVINNLRQAMATYANDFTQAECPAGSGEQCHRFAVLIFPGHNTYDCTGGPSFTAITNDGQGGALVDVAGFQAALAGVPDVCAEEPSLDVAFDAMSPIDASQIGFRHDAYPYIIVATDEEAQTWSNITDADVGLRASACNVGICAPGDSYEIYVITEPNFFQQWDLTTLGDPNRRKDLGQFQQSVAQGVAILQEIFQNVCLP